MHFILCGEAGGGEAAIFAARCLLGAGGGVGAVAAACGVAGKRHSVWPASFAFSQLHARDNREALRLPLLCCWIGVGTVFAPLRTSLIKIGMN